MVDVVWNNYPCSTWHVQTLYYFDSFVKHNSVCPYLFSKVLSLALKRLSNDWETIYGHPLFLAETFVDTARFKGICYQAANWLRVGKTKGSAKRGNTYRYHGQSKDVYLYPLNRNFRRFLVHDQR